MASVKCPDCGVGTDARGLASHRRGKDCKARRVRKRYAERGLVAYFARIELMEQAGIDVTYDTVAWDRSMKATLKGWYAPSWVGDVINATANWRESDRVEALRLANESEEARAAILVDIELSSDGDGNLAPARGRSAFMRRAVEVMSQ